MRKSRRTNGRRSLFSPLRKRTGSSRRSYRSSFVAERLEDRRLLAGDFWANTGVEDVNGDGTVSAKDLLLTQRAQSFGSQEYPNQWHNYFQPSDVNNDGDASVMDALIVVKDLRSDGIRNLPVAGGGEGEQGSTAMQVDVNNDASVSVGDVLSVIRGLRAEGEPGDQVMFRGQIVPASEVAARDTTVSTNTIDTVGWGENFALEVAVTDIRDPANFDDLEGPQDQGIFGFFLDVNYPSNLVAFDPRIGAEPFMPALFGGTEIRNLVIGGSYDDLFATIVDAPLDTPGLLDEIGATQDSFAPLGPDEVLGLTAEFRVGPGDDRFSVMEDSSNNVLDILGNDTMGGGTATFELNPADELGNVQPFEGPEIGPDHQMFVNPSVTVDVSGGVTVTNLTQPDNGTATLINNDTQVSYTPTAEFSGTDTFTYTLTNNGVDIEATVVVEVEPVNDPPSADNDSFTTDEDTTIMAPAPGVLDGDTDPDGDTLTVSASDNTSAQGATVTVNADGSFTYDPSTSTAAQELQDGETLNDSFTYTVDDGSGESNSSDTATVNITINGVNDDPVAVDDLDYMATEDETLSVDVASGLLANDTDVDSTNLTVSEVTQPANGTVAFNADGSFEYTPDLGFADATDTFTYTVVDGDGGSAVGTVEIFVEIGVFPRARNDSFDVQEDSMNQVLNPLMNDRLRDPAEATTTIIGLGPNNDQTITTSDGGTATIVSNGARVEYTPVGDFFGDVSFTYTIDDDFPGTVDNPSDPSTATITVTVNNVNDPVDPTPDMFNINEDTPTVFDVTMNDVGVDPADETLTISNISSPDPSGTAVVTEADGKQQILFTPAENFFGEVTFTYQVNDESTQGTATVTVEVAPVNDAPDPGLDTEATDEDTAINVSAADGLLTNDTDVDSDDSALVVTPATGTSELGASFTVNADGSYSYNPTTSAQIQSLAVGETDTDTFTYVVSDNETPSASATGTVEISLTGVNDQPDAVNDPDEATNEDTVLNANVLTNDTDVDESDTLTVTAFDETSELGASVSIAANGDVTYDPTGADTLQGLSPGQTLDDTFTYTISDGNGGTDTATVTVTVSGLDDAPIAVDDDNETDEDTLLTVPAPGLLDNDSDADDDDSPRVVDSDALSAAGAMITVNADGSFSYDPTVSDTLQALSEGATFNDTFTYTIDGGAGGPTDTATVSIEVTGVNDAPVAVDDGPFDVRSSDGQQVFQVLANDTDAEDDTLTVIDVSIDTVGSDSMVSTDGTTVTYTPGDEFEGVDLITYTVSDGNGGTDTATLTVNLEQFVPSVFSGFVFLDTNDNGQFDSGEEPVRDVAVHISGVDQNGVVDRTVFTDDDGSYNFGELGPTEGSSLTVSLPGMDFLIEPALRSGAATDVDGDAPSSAEFTLNQVDLDFDGDTDAFNAAIGQDGGVTSTNNNFSVRGLSPEFISPFDLLASSGNRDEVGLVAIGSGGVQFFLPATGNGWEDLADIQVTPVSSTHVHVQAMRTTDNQLLAGTVSVVDNSHVRVIGESDNGAVLIRLQGTPEDFHLMPVTGAGGEPPAETSLAVSPSDATPVVVVSLDGPSQQPVEQTTQDRDADANESTVVQSSTSSSATVLGPRGVYGDLGATFEDQQEYEEAVDALFEEGSPLDA